MAFDLNEAWGWIQRLIRRVERIESGAFLENASITSGRLRVIGGVLRVDSGGRVEIVGTLEIDGATEISGVTGITGPTTVTGSFTVSGPWEMTGNGTITGATSISGNVTVTGKLTQNGEWELNGNGKIQGDVDVTGGGKIRAGQLTISPTGDGGRIEFPGGRYLSAGSDAIAVLNGARGLVVGTSQITLLGVPTGTVDAVSHWLGMTAVGQLVAVPKGSGGPTGSGLLRWPFSLDLVTNEFNTTDPAYDPPGHRGIDFGAASGTPIPAAGAGTVLAVGYDSERGYFVILDHGVRDGRTLTTRYYHLIAPSALVEGAAIAKSATVGSVGSTGMSTGPHLHFETRYDGVAENPRAVMAVYGE